MLKPWQKEAWCIPSVGPEFVWRMEDVLDLYAEAEDPRRPRVCLDECPYQLVGEVRQAMAAQPGQPARYDYEYTRQGTCNLFMLLRPHTGWRHVKVTAQRTKRDFAICLQELVDVHFPEAECIRLVLDNLNTHSLATLYEVLPAAEARRIARKLELHYTPLHGSWLNMAEIELAILARQCLDRRLDEVETVCSEIAAWEAPRNAQRVSIDWRFTTADARNTLKRLYPS